jgi:selenocysteine lyase/cysteine desulfurase
MTSESSAARTEETQRLLGQPAQIRELFEIPDGVTYLNCANMAPRLRSVTQAGIDTIHATATPWKLTNLEWFERPEELRRLAAQVMGGEADGVALIPSASYGIATAASNLPLSPGQTILVLDRQFPSNVYAWRELAKRKNARVVTVLREPGENWTGALLRTIDDTTAIVSVPQCHWTDGSKVDLESVSKKARAVGSALVVDASQSLGAGSLDLARVQPDFLTSVGYKWLLGPYGLGYLYVAPKWREAGVPLEQSWMTRAGSENFTSLVDYTDEYREGARRFDMGEFSQFVLVSMAIAGLKRILEWGVPRIEESLLPITERIARLAADCNCSVLPPADRSAHLIGIRPKGGIPPELPKALKDAGVFVSMRGDSIRIAPHLYNEPKDVDYFFEILSRTGF